MASSHRASADLQQLVGVIAGRWQDLTNHDQGADKAPWGYLVGVANPQLTTTSPSAWPVHISWTTDRPQPGFTVLHCHPAIALRGFVTPPDWQAVGGGCARRGPTDWGNGFGQGRGGVALPSQRLHGLVAVTPR